MRLCTFVKKDVSRTSKEPSIGVVRHDSSVADVTTWTHTTSLESGSKQIDMLSFIEDQTQFRRVTEELLAKISALGDEQAETRGLLHPADKIRLKSPLRPKKIVAVLVNSQGMLGGGDIKLTHPRLFMKAPSTVIGPEEVIRAPNSGVRPEVELGIILGESITRVNPKEAEGAIFGYTVFNDVTAPRDSKEDAYAAYRRDSATGELRRTVLRGPLFRSKNHDTFGPMGPWIVTKEELMDVSSLKMQTSFNAEVIQQGSTKEYLFSPSEILSFISGFLTLEPGDLVAAGTIGWTAATKGLDPSEWILPSSSGILELEIEGIGVLRNYVKPADAQ